MSDPRPRAPRRWLAEAGLVAALAVIVARFSGSENWASRYTPDSEFYFSLAVFGSDVTDRAIYPAYYWTRLGVLVPQRALIESFGVWGGFAAYRLALLTVVVASAYVTVRRFWPSPALACAGALTCGLNTVVLSFAGDSYITGTAVAGLFLLLALTVCVATSREGPQLMFAAAAGCAMGWLAMINPYAVLLGSFTCATAFLLLARWSRTPLRRMAALVVAAAAAAWSIFVTFLFAGTLMFPGMGWLATTRQYVGLLDPADYTSATFDWARTETSLAVVLIAAAMAVGVWATTAAAAAARTGAALAGSGLVFAGLYRALQPGPFFEASFYSALLWPGALLGFVLAGCTVLAPLLAAWPAWVRWSAPPLVFAVAVAAGHSTAILSVAAAVAVTAGITAALAVAGVLLARASEARSRLLPMAAAALLAVAGLQVLQNGRSASPGVVERDPYFWAFHDVDAEKRLERALAVQRWVLEQTAPQDRVLVWVEPGAGFETEAAMQLWGPNSLSNKAKPTPVELAAAQAAQATVLVTYSATTRTAEEFTDSVRAAGVPMTAGPCTERGANDDTISVCVHRFG